MLVFNCTKAATDFFTTTHKSKKISPMSPKPKIEFVEEPILHDDQRWHWMIHAVKVKRKNVLLAMDSDSRFCMLFWGLKKGSAEHFIEEFHQRFTLHIATFVTMSTQDESTIENSIKKFITNHNEYTLVQRGHRSVQGHINDVLMSLPYAQHRWEGELPTEEELFISDLRNNDTFRKRKQDKDYILPAQELFQTWLSHYANLDEHAIEQAISQYRQEINQILRSPFDINIDDLDYDEIEAALSNNVLSLEDYTNTQK